MGLTATGKQFREPAATLQEYEDARGLKHTVIAFDPPFRGHPALASAVGLVRSFLEYPMVIGLVELTHVDLPESRFGYPTGAHWTLKELLRIHADLSMKMGLRAALEVAYLVGQILVEASQNGASQGCWSHGGLTPWRISVRPEGDLIVFGHGLPQVELLAHRADPSIPITADSLRYAPPERLSGLPEDLASDLAALTAIAFEVATGQPLYPGHEVEAVSRSIGMAEAAASLSRGTDALPAPVAQLFARALLFDPDSRMPAALWLDEIGSLYERHQEGDSLADIVARVRGVAPAAPVRRAAKFIGTDTAAYTPAQLTAALGDAADPVDAPPSDEVKVETRWSRPARRRAEPAPEAEPALGDDGTPRRRRRLRDSELGGESEPTPPPAPEGAAEAAGAEVGYRSREELRAEAMAEDDEESEPAEAPTGERPRRRESVAIEAPPGRRRRRRLDESTG